MLFGPEVAAILPVIVLGDALKYATVIGEVVVEVPTAT